MAGVIVPGAKPKESALDTVMKGLQIASSVYGIKADMAKTDALQAETKRKNEGILSPDEEVSMAKDFKQVPVGTEGALVRKSREGKQIAFLPKDAKESALVKITTKGKDGSPVTRFVKPQEGVDYAEYVAPKEKDPSKQYGPEDSLRKEYTSDPVYKNTKTVLEGYGKVAKAGNTQNPTGQTDMSLIFGFMKMQDPGSTVREGEYASAENTRGVDDNVRAMYNKILSGEKLTPEQRYGFVNAADGLLEAQIDVQRGSDEYYADIAKRRGIDPGNFLDKRFSSAIDQLAQKRGGKIPGQGGELVRSPESLDAREAAKQALLNDPAKLKELADKGFDVSKLKSNKKQDPLSPSQNSKVVDTMKEKPFKTGGL